MTVRLYKSTDASAPTLTGQVGSLTALLLAVLVNGYGSKTAAGWTQGQNTTNKSQFVMGAGGSGYSIWVDDNAPGGAGAREARVSGYATMSATTPTGTGQFPTAAQSTIGTGMLAIRKSASADATTRAWSIVADAHTFYLWTETGDYTLPVVPFSFGFGDFFPMGASDVSNCIIMGRQIENDIRAGAPSSSQNSVYESMPVLGLMNSTGMSNTIFGHYVPSQFTNIGGSVPVGKHSDQSKMGLQSAGAFQMVGFQGGVVFPSQTTPTWTNQFNYPNGPDSGLYMAPIFIHHGGHLRGYLKGLWCPLQHIPMNHNDTFNGTGNLSGKTFLAQNALGIWNNGSPTTSNLAGQFFVETSDTWA